VRARPGIGIRLELDEIGGKIKEALEHGYRTMEDALGSLETEFDRVDIGLNPVVGSIRKKIEEGARGVVTYSGGFRSYGDEKVFWLEKELAFDEILSSLHSAEVEKVLSAISNRHKMDILLALLEAPMSVNELVAYLHLNSTGQAYHYLKGLLAAKVVVEDPYSKGVYTINKGSTKGLVMILAGVRDLIKSEGGYSADWADEELSYQEKEGEETE
jgi:DNA-binding transcriptional ArsR family regulator